MTSPSSGTPRATMTVTEAAQLLGIGRDAAYKAVGRGEIPSVRVGRRILVPVAALERMLAVETPRPAPEAAGHPALGESPQ